MKREVMYLYLDDIREFNFHLSPDFPCKYFATVKSVNVAKFGLTQTMTLEIMPQTAAMQLN